MPARFLSVALHLPFHLRLVLLMHSGCLYASPPNHSSKREVSSAHERASAPSYADYTQHREVSRCCSMSEFRKEHSVRSHISPITFRALGLCGTARSLV